VETATHRAMWHQWENIETFSASDLVALASNYCYKLACSAQDILGEVLVYHQLVSIGAHLAQTVSSQDRSTHGRVPCERCDIVEAQVFLKHAARAYTAAKVEISERNAILLKMLK